MEPRYFVGLDLGCQQDYTALVVLEQSLLADPKSPRRTVAYYAARHLERFPLGTPYTTGRALTRTRKPRTRPSTSY